MKRKEDSDIPEFPSLDEEREYWEARGPLAEGHKGRLNKPKPGQKRSSFLAVRLTGEELTRLRDIAAKQGLGPSTFARLVLTSAVENRGKLPRRVTVDDLKTALEGLPQDVKQRAQLLAEASAIGDPNNPALIVIDQSQMKAWEEFGLEFIKASLALIGVQVITPQAVEDESQKSTAVEREAAK